MATSVSPALRPWVVGVICAGVGICWLSNFSCLPLAAAFLATLAWSVYEWRRRRVTA